jgi:dCTP deaminase
MAFWSNKTWAKRGKAEKVVTPWDASRIKEADYILSVGKEYFTNSDGGTAAQQLDEGEGFCIEPGQFAFILTAEKLNIPLDAIALISARASTKFQGLVNVSGFQVNPGFKGNFVFAMFNAGPRKIILRRGDRIFSIWVVDLDSAIDPKGMKGGQIPNELDHIESVILNKITGEALTAYQVKALLDKQNTEIAKLSDSLSDVRTTFNWIKAAGAVLFGVFFLLMAPTIRERAGFSSGTGTETDTLQQVPGAVTN